MHIAAGSVFLPVQSIRSWLAGAGDSLASKRASESVFDGVDAPSDGIEVCQAGDVA
jgi:hypothetical protein